MKNPLFLLGILVLLLSACRNGGSTDGDADADADDDGGGDADADGDDGDGFTPGCYPELGVCDPVAQCGCADGQLCDVTLEGTDTIEFCQGETGGTGVHGDEGCSEGTCAPGFFCRPWADADGNPTTFCRKWCLDDEDCSAYPGSHCNDQLAYELPDGSIVAIEPYRLCSPEDVGLGAGTAEFTVCTGLEEDCPGNPPFGYSIGGGDVNGRCNIDAAASPATLTFNLRDTDQGLSITANEVRFDLAAAGSGFVSGSAGERTRFTMIMPPDSEIYTTELLASPPGRGYCDLRVRYREAEQGFDLEFTCNHIRTAFTDYQLVTIVDDSLGPGTLSMDGCEVTL